MTGKSTQPSCWIRSALYQRSNKPKSNPETTLNELFVSHRYSCGNCSLNHIRNINECYCCKKLEGFCEALESQIFVVEDLKEGQVLKCTTEHPGSAWRSGACDLQVENTVKRTRGITRKLDRRKGEVIAIFK